MKRKLLTVILVAAFCVSLAVPVFAGGFSILEFKIEIRNSQTPAQFTLNPGDLNGDFVFTNENGDTITVPSSVFVVSGGKLSGHFFLISEDYGSMDSSEILVESTGKYALTAYPSLPAGYSFDTTGYSWSSLYGNDEEHYVANPLTFEFDTLDDSYGTYMYFLSVNSGAAASTPPAPQTQTVNPTASTVYLNGEAKAFEAYNIGGNNYFKLRDLAYVLNGTEKQFEVGYDNATKAITLTSGQPYTAAGGEMAAGDGQSKTAAPTPSQIYLDGKVLNLTVYNISGNNFFKLRDLMEAVDVYVEYDNATNAIALDTSRGYATE